MVNIPTSRGPGYCGPWYRRRVRRYHWILVRRPRKKCIERRVR